MKRTYKAPTAKMVDFKYDDQVVASSVEPEYCWGVIWKGPLNVGYCTNPGDWTGDPLYLNPGATAPNV